MSVALVSRAPIDKAGPAHIATLKTVTPGLSALDGRRFGVRQRGEDEFAEFVAQEEMNRDEGYWWSPDSRSLLVQETDTAGLEQCRRPESVELADGAERLSRARIAMVDVDYFAELRQPILSGRAFDAGDLRDGDERVQRRRRETDPLERLPTYGHGRLFAARDAGT